MSKSDILFEQYYEDVFRFLRGISKDEHLAEELTQETFYRFHEEYELLAMNSDASYGFVYALTGGDNPYRSEMLKRN